MHHRFNVATKRPELTNESTFYYFMIIVILVINAFGAVFKLMC